MKTTNKILKNLVSVAGVGIKNKVKAESDNWIVLAD